MTFTSCLNTFLPCALIGLMLVITACQETESVPDEHETAPVEDIVEIRAMDYAFEIPDTVMAGWNTLRLNNEQGHEIHEIGLGRLPDGYDLSDYMADVMPIWEEGVRAYEDGEVADGPGFYGMVGPMLPEWYHDEEGVGTRTLVSPGRSTQNHFYLEPGTYVVECWVKAPGGRPHILLGMVGELTVLSEENDRSDPDVDVEVRFSGSEIETEGTLGTGNQTIALRLEDDPEYDNIQLIRLDDETDLAGVATWLDWFSEGGLEAPAPADFLGGFHAYGIPQPGNSAYFTVEDVEPGRYAWILEAPAEEEMWTTFTIE